MLRRSVRSSTVPLGCRSWCCRVVRAGGVPPAALPTALHGGHAGAHLLGVALEGVRPGGRGGPLVGAGLAVGLAQLGREAGLTDAAGQTVEERGGRGRGLRRGRVGRGRYGARGAFRRRYGASLAYGAVRACGGVRTRGTSPGGRGPRASWVPPGARAFRAYGVPLARGALRADRDEGGALAVVVAGAVARAARDGVGAAGERVGAVGAVEAPAVVHDERRGAAARQRHGAAGGPVGGSVPSSRPAVVGSGACSCCSPAGARPVQRRSRGLKRPPRSLSVSRRSADRSRSTSKSSSSGASSSTGPSRGAAVTSGTRASAGRRTGSAAESPSARSDALRSRRKPAPSVSGASVSSAAGMKTTAVVPRTGRSGARRGRSGAGRAG